MGCGCLPTSAPVAIYCNYQQRRMNMIGHDKHGERTWRAQQNVSRGYVRKSKGEPMRTGSPLWQQPIIKWVLVLVLAGLAGLVADVAANLGGVL